MKSPPLNRDYARHAGEVLAILFDGLALYIARLETDRKRNEARLKYNARALSNYYKNIGYRQAYAREKQRLYRAQKKSTLPIDARSKSCGS